VVPGNHDAYVRGAVKKARTAWWPFMRGDGDDDVPSEKVGSEATFPYVRKRGDVAIIGVTTGRATAPWFASGRVGTKQSRRLRAILEELAEEKLFRVVLIHHPPFKNATKWHKRLSDASRLRVVVKRAGAELILHGHTHIDSFESIEGPNGPVPVIGVPSATSAPGGHKPAARYNLFSIARQTDGWTCQMEEHGFEESGGPVKPLSRRDIAVPST
jgi:3',5'-cyclic AMP phosphodiesterase CpdA